LLLRSGWVQAQAPKGKGPERFEKDILAFEAADQESPPPKNATLFVGASNIRRWTLSQNFKNVPVINRGFGGSYLRDVLHYADRIILPYEPKTIVLQAGGNDLNGGRTPDEVFADFKTLVEKIHTRLPMTSITVLSIPPAEARWSQVDAMRATNKLMREYSAGDSRLTFIDLFDSMVTTEGLPRRELFVDDKLHVNEQGYELWTSLIRWEKEIKALEETDRKNLPKPGGIVFVGSSSIKRWTNLAEDFPDLPVINHGFGGSQIFDSVVFAHRIIIPLKPRMVVFYAGGNDINAGKTADRVVSDFQALVKKIHTALPETRIAYISIAGNPARWKQVDEVKAANKRVEEYSKSDPRLAFINVFPHMLGTDGLPKPDIFVADRLHMNPQGYEIWKEQIRPFLE
jgi:lysophospholipase L1-like esterase